MPISTTKPSTPIISDRALATPEKVTTMSDFTASHGTLTPLPETADAFDRAYAFLMAMTELQIAQTAEKLFKDNHYQQIIFVCWLKGVQNGEIKAINPRSYAPNFVGEPGLGKTGMVMEAGGVIENWLSDIAGEFVEFRIEVLSLASVNDISEVLGIVHLDHVNKKTCIYPHENLPVKGDRTFGLLFMDDVNRGNKDAQAGIMQLASALSYNGYRMPRTWGVLAATNPSGKDHNVKSQDKAQASRWVSILYSPSRDKSFVGQLQIQGVDVAFTGYCMKFKHIAPVPSSAGILPDVPYTNFRNVTMIGHLYGVLKHLPRAWQEVAFSNLGPNEMANLQAMLTGELPLSPHEVIGVHARERKLGEVGETPAKAWELAKPRLLAMHKEGRTDLVAVTVHALVRHLNNDQFDLSDDQLDVLGELWTTLPKEAAHDALRRLVLADAPRNAYYKPKFTGWKSPDGVKPGPLSHYFVNLLAEVRAQLKEGLGRQAS